MIDVNDDGYFVDDLCVCVYVLVQSAESPRSVDAAARRVGPTNCNDWQRSTNTHAYLHTVTHSHVSVAHPCMYFFIVVACCIQTAVGRGQKQTASNVNTNDDDETVTSHCLCAHSLYLLHFLHSYSSPQPEFIFVLCAM